MIREDVYAALPKYVAPRFYTCDQCERFSLPHRPSLLRRISGDIVVVAIAAFLQSRSFWRRGLRSRTRWRP